ncbi:MAG TPA: TetR/AcrR family transcriptional regulator [Sandaracinaceae bacterium LLY-WYZ-13_1]|nr:TetR/AcrR family transcriptional regulator [Sandaracinaceae bacterium LLY-WYZ-13_1]
MSADEAERRRLARKRRRQEKKRDAILGAASEALLAGGLDAFTVGAVAERADLSKPAVYYYFDSRDELLAALLLDWLRAETEACLAAVEAASGGVAALEAVVRAYVAHHRRDLASFRILQAWSAGAGDWSELFEREIVPLSWRLMGRLEALLREDAEAGRLHPDAHPRRLANLALMLAHGVVNITAFTEGVGGTMRFGLDAMVEEACATLRRGAGAG